MDKIYIKKRKRKTVERRTKSLIISDFAYDSLKMIADATDSTLKDTADYILRKALMKELKNFEEE